MNGPVINTRDLINHGKQLAEIEQRERVVRWMIERGYATGHGGTIEDLLAELEGHLRERKEKALNLLREARSNCVAGSREDLDWDRRRAEALA